MQLRINHKATKLLGVLFCCFTTLQCAIAQNDQIYKEYIALYTSKEFDTLAHLFYTDSSTFEDPTMSFFSADGSYDSPRGKQEIVAFLKHGFSNLSNLVYKSEQHFTAGSIHYNRGMLEYNYQKSQNDSSKTFKFSLPLTIILRSKDGKIIHHQDFANYNVWLEQYNQQSKNN